MKAKQLPKLIPNSVRVTKDVTYEIVYIDGFIRDDCQYGECRKEERQIVLNKNQSPTEMMKSTIHEIFHSIDFENEIGLTEKQVVLLEEGVFRVLKLNNVFDMLKG